MALRIRLIWMLIATCAALAPPPRPASAQDVAIVAVVNGDVVSHDDVDNRRRLFAMSTGLPTSRDVLDRLSPQVTRQLVDERLRLQEIQRRRIVVSDQDIAKAMSEVESRNGLPAGELRRKLGAAGVDPRTLIDQIRVQIGWSRVLRQVLGAQAEISKADIEELERGLKEQTGQPEYRLSEIFVPIDTPAAADEARKFADTVIQQLRAGAPFPVVAAQFSQSQTALEGGDLGWVRQNQMDPEVLRVVTQMPVGAISNPLRVAGGLSIVTLREKRLIGQDPATILTVRQAFAPFPGRLDPQHPTPEQRKAYEDAVRVSNTAKSCEAIEAANQGFGNAKPTDPGEVRLESVSPALRQILASLPPGKASPPLPSETGIMVVMICAKQEKNMGLPSEAELRDRILSDRVELASRQLMRDLQRRAVLDQRA
jgi:peptidyl-prolyl cis-trans isomerase SurA